ncbi:hypothetical protein [Lederbergia citri]|uniref:Uncharacterized protein n=1 Tax=Lederbergia citri TaxID=2833580 RepID=A0A942TEP0_9BACI|nr:hypothetical protein [Lederbergia citri]MBS4195391.1 hypothetical protein [Lederbergia citri]
METKNKPFYKRWWFVVIVVFLAIGVIGNIVDPSEAEEKPSTSETKSKETKADKPKELTLEEKIESAVDDTLGAKTNTKEKRIDKIEVYTDVVNVWMNADENLSANMTKKGMWRDTFKTLEELAKLDEVNRYQFVWMLPLTDKLGNSENGKVMSLDFPREIFSEINFDNVDYNKAPDIAEDYWEHNALK